jgi:hypothetical protein
MSKDADPSPERPDSSPLDASPPHPSRPRLVHFEDTISSEDRDRLERALLRVEGALQLTPVPTQAGATWIITAPMPEWAFASRIGFDEVLRAPSIDALIARLDAMCATGCP